MEKVVIIGSGCAGLTAALYTARANLRPLVLTGVSRAALTTTSVVENYPGFPEGIDGYELMARMQKQAERFGARVKFGSVEAVDLSRQPFVLTVDGEPVEAETIIIATGASHRHLGLESEHKLENKGVTYCATCDGALPIFRNQPLVVVGGGDSACEEAMYLTRFGSSSISSIAATRLRASKIMAERTLCPCEDQTGLGLGRHRGPGRETGQGHRRALEERQNQRRERAVDCAGVFVAIGHIPNTQLFKGVIDMDESGYILPKHGTATNVPGVFVRRRLRRPRVSPGDYRRRHGLRGRHRGRTLLGGEKRVRRVKRQIRSPKEGRNPNSKEPKLSQALLRASDFTSTDLPIP